MICPIGDSLRSVAGWLVVVLLLLLRKANRFKEAWTLFIPLFFRYIASWGDRKAPIATEGEKAAAEVPHG